MYTIIETRTFQAKAAALWNREDYEDFMVYIAQHPRAGNVIPGTGGVRKLRWRASGKGKRGGTRVIYCCQEESELWLLTLYAKGERESIPAHELKQIRETISGQANDQGR